MSRSLGVQLGFWPVAWLVFFDFAGRTVNAGLSRSALRQSQLRGGDAGDGNWNDMACFMDLSRYGFSLDGSSVVFRTGTAAGDASSPEVLVVQDKAVKAKELRRTLIFKSANGKCNPQAGTTCSRIEAPPTVGALSKYDISSLGVTDSVDRCSSETCTADVGSSLMEPGSGYIRSMVAALTFAPQLSKNPSAASRILSVGLGAGTLALTIRQAFSGSQQTVVELSGGVVQALGCFGAAEDGVEVVTADGHEYLMNAADNTFDAVLIDAFDGEDKIPQPFLTTEFFQTARRKLRAGGVLVMNAHSGRTLHNDLHDLLPAAAGAFSDMKLGSAPGLGNKIVVARVAAKAGGVASQQSAQAQQDSDSSERLQDWLADAAFAPVSNTTNA